MLAAYNPLPDRAIVLPDRARPVAPFFPVIPIAPSERPSPPLLRPLAAPPGFPIRLCDIAEDTAIRDGGRGPGSCEVRGVVAGDFTGSAGYEARLD